MVIGGKASQLQPNLDMKALALFYYILFFFVWLLSLGGLLFSEEEMDQGVGLDKKEGV